MTVNFELEDDAARITMDDGKANAVNDALLDALFSALDRAEREAKALILAGREGRFSAGYDLSVMRDGPPEQARALMRRGGGLLHRLYSFPAPVVAACSGHALAMGALILLACDARIGAAGDFKIGLNETAIGMTLPEYGIALPLARLDPRWLTRSVAQSEIYDPAGAVDAGFLDEVVHPEQLPAQSRTLAAKLAALPGDAYAANKLATRRETLERLSEFALK